MAVDVEGVELHLTHPEQIPVPWVGQEEVMRQLQAAWEDRGRSRLPKRKLQLGGS